MLFLVGVGLTAKDLSLRAVEVCKECELFADRYTSVVSDDHLEFIKGVVGKQIKGLGRPELEEGAVDIVSRAKYSNVAVLVGGDPLMATTHKILFREAQRQNVEIHVIHSSSIVSAAMGMSGLDFYRFGQIATIPRWSEHYEPVSFYNVIRKNMVNGEHSLLLLDFDSKEMKSLSIKDGISILSKAESNYKAGIINDATKLVILNSVSSEGEQRIFTTLGRARDIDITGASVIIIPAALTDIEKESVTSMCKIV